MKVVATSLPLLLLPNPTALIARHVLVVSDLSSVVTNQMNIFPIIATNFLFTHLLLAIVFLFFLMVFPRTAVYPLELKLPE